jgi:hypothetical protein
MTSNLLLFFTGAITFLVVFSWFKVAAMHLFKLEIASESDQKKVSWKKLFQVFAVDLLLCIIGVLGTGITFVVIFNLFH